jgi:hypothetical protein
MAFDDIIGKVEKLNAGPPETARSISYEDIKERVGKFSISNDYIVNSPDIILRIMRDMIVIEAIPNMNQGCVKYLAYSTRFDIIPNIKHGDEAPTYQIVLTRDGTANGTIEYRRI